LFLGQEGFYPTTEPESLQNSIIAQPLELQVTSFVKAKI